MSALTPNGPDETSADPSASAGEQQRVVVVTQDGMGVHRTTTTRTARPTRPTSSSSRPR